MTKYDKIENIALEAEKQINEMYDDSDIYKPIDAQVAEVLKSMAFEKIIEIIKGA